MVVFSGVQRPESVKLSKIGVKVRRSNPLDSLRKVFKLKPSNRDYDLLIVNYEDRSWDQMESTETEDEAGWNCSVHPSVFFLLGTLVLTTCATGMLCAAIMTDHWEEMVWDRQELERLGNGTFRLHWLLDGTVAEVASRDDEEMMGFLVPMHGGIWTLCISLTGEY